MRKPPTSALEEVSRQQRCRCAALAATKVEVKFFYLKAEFQVLCETKCHKTFNGNGTRDTDLERLNTGAQQGELLSFPRAAEAQPERVSSELDAPGERAEVARVRLENSSRLKHQEVISRTSADQLHQTHDWC